MAAKVWERNLHTCLFFLLYSFLHRSIFALQLLWSLATFFFCLFDSWTWMRSRIQPACLLCCWGLFFSRMVSGVGVGGAAEGTKPVFRGLRRHPPARPPARRCCWSSAGCVLFVATQQMFLPLSRLPFVPLCFLLFSFVLCVVVVVLGFFSFFFSFFNSRAAAIARLFVATVSVTRQSCFVGLFFLFLFFCPLAGVRTQRLPIVYCRRRGSEAKHVQIWPLSCIFFLSYFFFFFAFV